MSRLSGYYCPEGHRLGNITYKMEIKDTQNNSIRRQVRKIIDDVFYCQSCKKFFKFMATEVEFTPKQKTKEADG